MNFADPRMDIPPEGSRAKKRKRGSRGAQTDGDSIEGEAPIIRRPRKSKSTTKPRETRKSSPSSATKSALENDSFTPGAGSSDAVPDFPARETVSAKPSRKTRRGPSKGPKLPAKEQRALLNPPGAKKTFYQHQAIQGRKRIKELEEKLKCEQDGRETAEEKLATFERQTLSRREEDLKDVQKEKLSVMDDTDVRSELDELMDMCKNFAKRWAQSGSLADTRSPEEIDAVYNMTCGQDSTTSCRLMALEYGKLFAWDAGAARMLLEALFSHFVQHKVLERPFRLLARNFTLPDAEVRLSTTEAVLREIFSDIMDRSTTAAHLWRAQTVRALCTGEGGLVDLKETSKRVQSLIARFVNGSIEEFEKTAAPILTRRTDGAQGMQMISELKTILSRAATLTPRLWLQNVHLQSWGCSGDDFRQTLDSRRAYLQLHNTMKHVPGDKKYDNLSMHIFTRPAILAHVNGRVTAFKVWVKAVGWRSSAEGPAQAKASWEAKLFKLTEEIKPEEVLEPESTGNNAAGGQTDVIRCAPSTDVKTSAISGPSKALLMSTATICVNNDTIKDHGSPSSPSTPPLNPQSVSKELDSPKSLTKSVRRPASGTLSSIGSRGVASEISSNTAQPGYASSGVRGDGRQDEEQKVKVAGKIGPASGRAKGGRSTTDSGHGARQPGIFIDLTAPCRPPSLRKE